jgi:hypothetical protein
VGYVPPTATDAGTPDGARERYLGSLHRSADGGIAWLGWKLSEHGGAAEADFQRFYGIDLIRATRTGELTFERLLSLLRHLPGEGAFFSAILKAEPELAEPPKPKKHAASPEEIARMFGLKRSPN